MKKVLFIFFSVLVIGIIPALAAEVISGKVKDSVTNEPLPEVKVVISACTTFTDSDGSFSLLLPSVSVMERSRYETVRLNVDGFQKGAFDIINIDGRKVSSFEGLSSGVHIFVVDGVASKTIGGGSFRQAKEALIDKGCEKALKKTAMLALAYFEKPGYEILERPLSSGVNEVRLMKSTSDVKINIDVDTLGVTQINIEIKGDIK